MFDFDKKVGISSTLRLLPVKWDGWKQSSAEAGGAGSRVGCEEPLQGWDWGGCEADGAECVCSVCCICHVLLSSQLGFSSCSLSRGKCRSSSVTDFSSPILPVFVPFSSAEHPKKGFSCTDLLSFAWLIKLLHSAHWWWHCTPQPLEGLCSSGCLKWLLENRIQILQKGHFQVCCVPHTLCCSFQP